MIDDLEDLKFITLLEAEIVYMQGRYHQHVKDGDYEWADMTRKVIDLLKTWLEMSQNELIASDSGGEIPPAQPGGDKTVFILKR